MVAESAAAKFFFFFACWNCEKQQQRDMSRVEFLYTFQKTASSSGIAALKTWIACTVERSDRPSVPCEKTEESRKTHQCTSGRQNWIPDTENNTVSCVRKATVHAPVEAVASAWFNKQWQSRQIPILNRLSKQDRGRLLVCQVSSCLRRINATFK